jgi:UMP-CMP kinase
VIAVIFVLGGPGSGKGTTSAAIEAEFGYEHLCVGDMLRAEADSKSSLSNNIRSYLREGQIVPAEITVKILKKAMEKSGNTKFIVDGFPRDLKNVQCWNENMAAISEIQFVLFLDCPHDVMISRLLERGKHSDGRCDDNEEAINKRIDVFEQSTRAIIDSFRAEGKVREVSSNRSFEDVLAEVSLHFMSIM